MLMPGLGKMRGEVSWRTSGKGGTIDMAIGKDTCAGRVCPTGQRCITALQGGPGSVCMEVYGQDCELSPCPQGLHCNRTPSTSTPGKIWMECSRVCGEGEPPCPEGTVCSFYQCRQACDPQEPSVCALGFSCRRHEPGQPWTCMPSSNVASAPSP